MATSNKACFVTTIVLDILDKVDIGLFVPLRRTATFSKIIKSVVLSELLHLESFSVLPFCIFVLHIDSNAIAVVTWYLVPKLE